MKILFLLNGVDFIPGFLIGFQFCTYTYITLFQNLKSELRSAFFGKTNSHFFSSNFHSLMEI